MLFINSLFSHCFTQFFHRLLNLKTGTISADLIMQSRKYLKQTPDSEHLTPVRCIVRCRNEFSSYVCSILL